MFHQGDLNSGISAAITQQKLVACFVVAAQDGSQQSTVWEHEWLPDLQHIINEKAVILRINEGSKEAGFLGAFCKIDHTPTLIIIHNGKVLDQLEGGLDQNEWKQRLLRALGVEQEPERSVIPTVVGETQSAPALEQLQSERLQLNPSSPTTTNQSGSRAPLSTDTHNQTPSTLFPDRAARLEADRAAREAAEAEARKARAEARRKEVEQANAAPKTDKGKQRATSEESEKARARDAWIYQQKQRKEGAKKERERILNQIESDRQERKARAARTNGATSHQNHGESSPLPDARIADAKRSTGAGGMCSLQVRLFDGSSIRSRFPSSTATLAKDVRAWISEQAHKGSGGADIPYNFRQILAPSPSRTIEVSEEHRSLADLDLVPNATLVLVPVAGSVDAYANSAAGAGYLGWVYSWLGTAYNTLPNVSYYLPSFSRLYLGGTADNGQPSNAGGAAATGAANVRRQLPPEEHPQAKRDRKTEFYNGNGLGFEPRSEEDGK